MKSIILRISVVATFIAIVGLMITKYFKRPTTYEYYTFDNSYGTSLKCEAKEKIQCEIEGVMVEVKQFSEK